MTNVRHLTLAFLWMGVLMPAVCFSENVFLKEMPKDGDIRFGKIVYVDDGECPKDEVKEVTGGSQAKGIPRKVRCVKRPSNVPRKSGD